MANDTPGNADHSCTRKDKGKAVPVHAKKANKGRRIALLIRDLGNRQDWYGSCPGRITYGTRHKRMLGGSQNRSERTRNIC